MDNGAIDQEYYEMVKAKLSLLSKEWASLYTNDNVNMNVLKSALKISKNEANNPQVS